MGRHQKGWMEQKRKQEWLDREEEKLEDQSGLWLISGLELKTTCSQLDSKSGESVLGQGVILSNLEWLRIKVLRCLTLSDAGVWRTYLGNFCIWAFFAEPHLYDIWFICFWRPPPHPIGLIFECLAQQCRAQHIESSRAWKLHGVGFNWSRYLCCWCSVFGVLNDLLLNADVVSRCSIGPLGLRLRI